MRPALPICLAAGLLLASNARAQEAISTAANAPGGGAPAAASAEGPIILSRKTSERDDRGPMPIGPCGGVAKSVDGGPPKPDKNPHGEIWGGVGTHGYREAGGVVCVPIGQTGAVTIAVDSARWGRR